MAKQHILMLVDYRGTFYSSTKRVAGSMDVPKLIQLFEKTDLNICSIKLSNTDAPGNFDSFWKIILN